MELYYINSSIETYWLIHSGAVFRIQYFKKHPVMTRIHTQVWETVIKSTRENQNLNPSQQNA